MLNYEAAKALKFPILKFLDEGSPPPNSKTIASGSPVKPNPQVPLTQQHIAKGTGEASSQKSGTHNYVTQHIISTELGRRLSRKVFGVLARGTEFRSLIPP